MKNFMILVSLLMPFIMNASFLRQSAVQEAKTVGRGVAKRKLAPLSRVTVKGTLATTKLNEALDRMTRDVIAQTEKTIDVRKELRRVENSLKKSRQQFEEELGKLRARGGLASEVEIDQLNRLRRNLVEKQKVKNIKKDEFNTEATELKTLQKRRTVAREEIQAVSNLDVKKATKELDTINARLSLINQYENRRALPQEVIERKRVLESRQAQLQRWLNLLDIK